MSLINYLSRIEIDFFDNYDNIKDENKLYKLLKGIITDFKKQKIYNKNDIIEGHNVEIYLNTTSTEIYILHSQLYIGTKITHASILEAAQILDIFKNCNVNIQTFNFNIDDRLNQLRLQLKNIISKENLIEDVIKYFNNKIYINCIKRLIELIEYIIDKTFSNSFNVDMFDDIKGIRAVRQLNKNDIEKLYIQRESNIIFIIKILLEIIDDILNYNYKSLYNKTFEIYKTDEKELHLNISNHNIKIRDSISTLSDYSDIDFLKKYLRHLDLYYMYDKVSLVSINIDEIDIPNILIDRYIINNDTIEKLIDIIRNLHRSNIKCNALNIAQSIYVINKYRENLDIHWLGFNGINSIDKYYINNLVNYIIIMDNFKTNKDLQELGLPNNSVLHVLSPAIKNTKILNINKCKDIHVHIPIQLLRTEETLKFNCLDTNCLSLVYFKNAKRIELLDGCNVKNMVLVDNLINEIRINNVDVDIHIDKLKSNKIKVYTKRSTIKIENNTYDCTNVNKIRNLEVIFEK